MTKKRIILTSAIGTVALGTLAVSLTLAWYGASNLLSINTFDISIEGNTTLKLSTRRDLDSFKEELTAEELKENFLFEPVSSIKKETWMDEQKDMPEFYDVFGLKQTTGFFSKKIYLLSSLSYYVSLDVDEGKTYFNNDSDSNFARAQTIYADMKKQDPDTTVTINQIQESLDNLKNCIRMSILVNVEGNYKYYIIDPYKDETDPVKYGGMLDIKEPFDGYYDTYIDYLDYSKEKTKIYGEYNDESLIVYNNPVNTNLFDNINTKTYDPFFGNCFEGVQNPKVYTYNEAASYANGFEIKEEESISLEDLRNNDSLIKIPCYQNVVTEIVISVYLEGWDHQCINSTTGANFDSKISFKLNGGIV